VNDFINIHEQLAQDYFPCIVDLRNFVHISYWSDFHLITQALFDLLPFGQLFGGNQFYAFTNYQLGPLADEARRNLLFWSLANVTTFIGQRAHEIMLHYNDTVPSFGIMLSQPKKLKYTTSYLKGIELDFYPNFNCRKPKLKWSSKKFDSIQTTIPDMISSVPTAESTHICGETIFGKPILLIGKPI